MLGTLSATDIAVLVIIAALSGFYIYIQINNKRIEESNNVTHGKAAGAHGFQPTSAKSLVAQMKAGRKNLVAFYGSQTGTAEDFASRFASEAAKWGFSAMAADLEDYDMEELEAFGADMPSATLAVFFMATYGEGEPTDNAFNFISWLRELDTDPARFSGLNYCVFGLGNTSYEYYQAMALLVDDKLHKNGANRVLSIGIGNDNENIESDFIKWKKSAFPKLSAHFATEVDMSQTSSYMAREITIEILPQPAAPSCASLIDHKAPNIIYTGEIGKHKTDPKYSVGEPDVKNPALVPLVRNIELLPLGHERSCRHIELDLTDSNLRYTSGDHLGVYPTNSAVLVDKLLDILGLDGNAVFNVLPIDPKLVKKRLFPNPTSFRTCFTHYLEIQSLPKQHHLYELSQYASGKDRAFLEHISSSDGEEEYTKFIVDNAVCFVDFLEHYRNIIKFPVDHLLELIPRLNCRYYSISSSALVYPKTVHLTAVVVDYSLPPANPCAASLTLNRRKGVCTGYLQALQAAAHQLPIFIRRSNFKMPRRLTIPMILIGPGTGVAPLRAFIQERRHLIKDIINQNSFAKSFLYFGCRTEQDHLYKDEMVAFEQDGVLVNRVAYSRMPGQPKAYVQHLLHMDGALLWKLIDTNSAYIYVCGDAKGMAVSVHDALKNIMIEHGQLTEPAAQAYIKRLFSQGRYSQDVW